MLGKKALCGFLSQDFGEMPNMSSLGIDFPSLCSQCHPHLPAMVLRDGILKMCIISSDSAKIQTVFILPQIFAWILSCPSGREMSQSHHARQKRVQTVPRMQNLFCKDFKINNGRLILEKKKNRTLYFHTKLPRNIQTMHKFLYIVMRVHLHI